jgi:hypothetical protein
MIAVWLLLLYAYAYVMYGDCMAVACCLHVFLVYSLLANEPLTFSFGIQGSAMMMMMMMMKQ